MNPKVLIVEDEALIADHLAAELEDLSYMVTAILDEPEKVFEHLQEHEVDLVLLDINLGADLDGVDIAHVIKKRFQLRVVFITSNSDKATLERVRHTDPAGFITKPFKKEQLQSTLALALGKASEPIPDKENAFFIREKHALIKVKYADVLYAEANDNYCFLHTLNARFLLSQTLKAVESKLLPHGFLRCHRSFLVNLSAIEKLEPKSIYIGHHEIPMSESHKPNIISQLNLF